MDKDKIGYYILALPADTLASMCVQHLMRHLFQEFISDIHKQAEMVDTKTKKYEVNMANEIKIPAITLFSELGGNFDKELKHKMTTNKSKKK